MTKIKEHDLVYVRPGECCIEVCTVKDNKFRMIARNREQALNLARDLITEAMKMAE